MKVVIDTNILLHIASPLSKNYWVFKSFLNGKYSVAFSNEILLEYEEIISKKMSADYFQTLYQLLMFSPNTHRIIEYFKWNLISIDADDNKFVDVAIAANADYIVSEDKHFKILKTVSFPKVLVIGLDDFKDKLKNGI